MCYQTFYIANYLAQKQGFKFISSPSSIQYITMIIVVEIRSFKLIASKLLRLENF